MNRCNECKHKNSCVCVPYGCECFEFDLAEHDKQIRAEVIDERAGLLAFICNKYNIPLLDMNCTVDEWEQLKEETNEYVTIYENVAYNQALADFRREINRYLCDIGDSSDFMVSDDSIDTVIKMLSK